MLIDSHAHIQLDRFQRDRDEVLRRAELAGVEKILLVGFDLETSREAVALAESREQLFATVGMHPHSAEMLDQETIDIFRELATHRKVVAIGEIGLDYYRNRSAKERQKIAFEQQLQLADELDLPVVIHNREAFHDTIPILRAQSNGLRGVLHAFSGTLEHLQFAIELGFKIGIGGPITYKKSEQLREVVKNAPAETLLIETDCPWLAPQAWRGKRNEPSYLHAIAEKISEIRNSSVDKIAKITTENFTDLFGC